MKFAKYLLVACLGLIFAACSNDDWNTDGNVSVEMANATIRTKENIGTFYVPLKVNGTTNGPIQVTVDVQEYSASPAVEDVNYLITSKTVVIPTDTAQVSIEILAVNDMELNDDRMFIVSIVKAEGATIGAQNTTTVTIRDDDGLFYEAIQGDWTWSDYEYYDQADEQYTMKVSGVDEESSDYEKILYFAGWGGVSSLVGKVEYSIDANNEITLYIPYGQVLGQLNFTGLGVCDVVLYGVEGGYLVDDGGFYGTVSPDLKSVTFEPNLDVIYYVEQGGEGLGAWSRFSEPAMNR